MASYAEDPAPGLNRAPMHTYGPVDSEMHENEPQSEDLSDEDIGGDHRVDGRSDGLSRLRRITRKLKAGLHPKGIEDPEKRIPASAPILAPEAPESDQRARLTDEGPKQPKSHHVHDFLHQPLGTLRSLAQKQGGKEFAENLADNEAPHDASVKLVLAHERIAGSTDEKTRSSAIADYKLHQKTRQDLFVRWTMARHVTNVKIVRKPSFPDLSSKGGDRGASQWLKKGHRILDYYLETHAGEYIGASSDLPEATADAVTSSIERLLISSIPIQNLVMALSGLSHWVDPIVTAGYALFYLVLCVYDYVPRALILYIIFAALKNKYMPATISDLREKLERSENADRAAQDLNELIVQHGARGWANAVIEKSGPSFQLQVEDLADFMEVLQNFFEWRDPPRTARTLASLTLIWLAITFTPIWLLSKGLFIGIGISFFIITPISSRYPQYRLLLSPFTWLFWKVPNHGQWAIARLQVEAAQQLSRMSAKTGYPEPQHADPQTGPENASNATDIQAAADVEAEASKQDPSCAMNVSIGRYRCVDKDRHGTLCLDLDGAYFETTFTKTLKWRVKYKDLRNIQKLGSSSGMKQGDDIMLVDAEGQEYRVSGLTERDEAFTQIVGYSRMPWQIIG